MIMFYLGTNLSLNSCSSVGGSSETACKSGPKTLQNGMGSSVLSGVPTWVPAPGQYMACRLACASRSLALLRGFLFSQSDLKGAWGYLVFRDLVF